MHRDLLTRWERDLLDSLDWFYDSPDPPEEEEEEEEEVSDGSF